MDPLLRVPVAMEGSAQLVEGRDASPRAATRRVM
jgi:hypothetical protein